MNTGSIPPPGPLTYEGQVAIPSINRTFPPQSTFNKFPVPCFWIDTLAKNAYIQVAKPLGVADWVLLGGSPGALNTITTPDAVVVVPVAANITFINGSGMNITGSGSTITFNSSGTVSQMFTTDSGDAVPILDVIKILGTSVQGVSTSGSTNIVTITNADWTTAQKGVGVLADNAQAIAGSGTTQAVTPASLAAKLGTQTNHSLMVAKGTNAAFASLGVATNGAIPIGSTGADPVLGNITSSDGTLTVTNGAGTIDVKNGLPIAFVAKITTTKANVTGDNTFYTIIWDTIEQDNTGGAYNTGTGIFTAPTAGYYMLAACAVVTPISVSHTSGKFIFLINGSNQTDSFRANYYAMSDGGNLGVSLSTVYYLNATDTVRVILQVGGGAKTVGIVGTTAEINDVSHFSCVRL